MLPAENIDAHGIYNSVPTPLSSEHLFEHNKDSVKHLHSYRLLTKHAISAAHPRRGYAARARINNELMQVFVL